MMEYLKTATTLELIDDIAGAFLLFGMIFFGPYLIAILDAIFV